MGSTTFFLTLYSFLVIAGVIFLAIPVSFILFGLVLGFISIILNLSTALADIFLIVGAAPWRYWYIFFPITILGTSVFVIFTLHVKKTSFFRKIKLK
jgi:hypothetical protein